MMAHDIPIYLLALAAGDLQSARVALVPPRLLRLIFFRSSILI